MKLVKGTSIKLKKDDDSLSKVTVGCSWGENGHNADIDAMVFFLKEEGSPNRMWDHVYYGNRDRVKKYCKHYGDDTTGSNKQHESDNEVIFMDLNELPTEVVEVAVVLNAYTGEKLKKVPSLRARVYSGKPGSIEEVLGTFDISDNNEITTTSVLVGSFVRVGDEWNFEAMGTELKAHRVGELTELFTNAKTQSTSTSTESPRSDNFFTTFFGKIFN